MNQDQINGLILIAFAAIWLIFGVVRDIRHSEKRKTRKLHADFQKTHNTTNFMNPKR